jgi:hypothetical protein
MSYSSRISACEKDELGQRAPGILVVNMQHKESKPSDDGYSPTISACEKTGQQRQVSGDLQQSEFIPNVISYGSACSASGEARQGQRAPGLPACMQSTETQLGGTSYDPMISACEKAWQQQQQQQQQTQQQKQQRATEGMHRDGRLPDDKSSSSTASVCEKDEQGQPELGIPVGSQHKESKPSDTSCTPTISDCEETAQQRPASVDHQQNELGPNVISYKSTTSASEKAGRGQRAPGFLASLQHKVSQLNATSYNPTISSCEKAAQPGHTAQQASAVLEVCISGIDFEYQMTNEILCAFSQGFSRFGSVLEAKHSKDGATVYVSFAHPSQAEAAQRSMHEKPIPGLCAASLAVKIIPRVPVQEELFALESEMLAEAKVGQILHNLARDRQGQVPLVERSRQASRLSMLTHQLLPTIQTVQTHDVLQENATRPALGRGANNLGQFPEEELWTCSCSNLVPPLQFCGRCGCPHPSLPIRTSISEKRYSQTSEEAKTFLRATQTSATVEQEGPTQTREEPNAGLPAFEPSARSRRNKAAKLRKCDRDRTHANGPSA